MLLTWRVGKTEICLIKQRLLCLAVSRLERAGSGGSVSPNRTEGMGWRRQHVVSPEHRGAGPNQPLVAPEAPCAPSQERGISSEGSHPSVCLTNPSGTRDCVSWRERGLKNLFTSQQNGIRNYVQGLKYEQYFSLSLLPGAQVTSECMHSTSMARFQALL